MRVVEEAIADGVGLVRVADDAVPVGDRELAGDQDGGTFAPFLDDFDQVPAFGVAQRGQEPVVDGQQISLGQPCQDSSVGAVATANRQLVQEPRHPDVGGVKTPAAGAFDESRSQKTFPDAGRAGNDEIMPVLDPSTRAQGKDLGTVQAATMFEVDVFQRCGAVAQLRHTQTPGELAVLSGCPLLID